MLRAFGHLCRLLLAFVFLSAGVLKALDPEGFAREIAGYGILPASPSWLAPLSAHILIPVEVAVGAALLLNFRPVPSLALASGLMLVFIGAITFALATGQPLENCGCFGRNMPRSPQATLAEDAGFLAAGLAGIVAFRRSRPLAAARDGWRWKGAVLLLVVAASAVFAVASPALPIDDFVTALKPGVRWEELGIPVAEIDLGQGGHLVALLGMRDPASAGALGGLNELAASGRYSVIGLHSDDEAAYNEFFWQQGPAFPLYHASPGDLRRLHRRLPRYFALKAGVVTATWDTLPDRTELARVLG